VAISGNATVLPGVSGERNSDETPLGGESALALALRVGGEAASGNFIARLPADEDFGRASRSAASLSSVTLLSLATSASDMIWFCACFVCTEPITSAVVGRAADSAASPSSVTRLSLATSASDMIWFCSCFVCADPITSAVVGRV